MKKLWLLTICCSILIAEEAPFNAHPVDIPLTPITVVQQEQLDAEQDIAAIVKEEEEVAQELQSAGITIDLGQVFAGSPTIYSILFILSMASVGIWAYSLLSLRNAELFPSDSFETLKTQIESRHYDLAIETCQKNSSLLFSMVGAALTNRSQGQLAMLELMKAEGRRISVAYWQKISLLNEIAIIAPMIGLLGTVLGLFYAFYDLNRSAETISALFDGLGISVGTTLGGLVVAIVALMFHAMTKYRLIRQLAHVESKAGQLVQVIATPTERQP